MGLSPFETAAAALQLAAPAPARAFRPVFGERMRGRGFSRRRGQRRRDDGLCGGARAPQEKGRAGVGRARGLVGRGPG